MGVRDTVKFSAVAVAFAGLVVWISMLQINYASIKAQNMDHETRMKSLNEANVRMKRSLNEANIRMKRSLRNLPPPPPVSSPTGGATYIRWGRTVCPSGAELAYKGFAGGQRYNHEGGSAEYVCLSDNPTYENFSGAFDPTAWIYGIELELAANIPGSSTGIFDTTNASPSTLLNADLKCAVCRSRTKTSKLMIPGTNRCPSGWHAEYWGYLMTGKWTDKAKYSYACVDHAPEAGTDWGQRDDELTGAMYHVQGRCGSLPCGPYVHYYELTCVVCTK